MKWLIAAGGALIVLLHCYAGFFPSAANWGFHQLAFLPIYLKFGVPLLMVLCLVPAIQVSLLDVSRWTARKLFHRTQLPALLLMVGLSAAVFWIGRERTYFLGDGYLVARWLPDIRNAEDIATSFKNEPLPGFLAWNIYRALPSLNLPQSGGLAVQILSIACGVVSILAIYSLSKKLAKDELDQTLLFAFVAFSGGIQLMFGYVENYAPTYCCMLLFLTSSVDVLRGTRHPVVPAIVFAALFTCHFGMVVMAPALLFLFYRELRRGNTLNVVLSLLAMIGMIVLLLWLCGYSFREFNEVFLRSGTHLIPLLTVTANYQSYTLFDLHHFQDIANLQLLLSPFALFTLTIFIIFQFGKTPFKTPEWLFLLLTALCGLGFSFAVNCDIGMSRDWDMLATFNLGIVVIAAFTAIRFLEQDLRRRLLIVLTGITFLHTAAWVAVNAGEESSIARFERLQDSNLWGRRALTYSYEELAIFYRDRRDYQKVREYTLRYLYLDSTNNRLWGSAAQIFHLLGDSDREQLCYEKAIQYGTTVWQIYVDLGFLYASHHHYDVAIEMDKKGLELNPHSAVACNNLGEYIIGGKYDYKEAVQYFLQAVELSPNYPKALWNASECYYQLHDIPKMKLYLDKFLRLQPNGRLAPETRHLLESSK